MERIEKVLNKLSNLYEFNRKIQTYIIQAPPKIKGQPGIAPERKKHGVLGKTVSTGSGSDQANPLK